MTAITLEYGRKIPGRQDFSSECLHITITEDVEGDDTRIDAVIDALYQTAKEEVDRRLTSSPRHNGRPPVNRVSTNGKKASPKQVSYLLSLANQKGIGFQELGDFLATRTGKQDPYELSSLEASKVIDGLK
jgi:hypothetical protein